jgi:SAM-dependent methyltransferase
MGRSQAFGALKIMDMNPMRAVYNLAKTSPSLMRIGRVITGRYVHSSERFVEATRQKHGLEIGGPSAAFGDAGFLPIYRYAASLDNTVYSASTPFSNDPRGDDFQFHPRKAAGKNLIFEASVLTDIKDGSYDFVLSSHCLEHCANPIKALKEWQRVVRPGGAIIVILPHFRHTFDHRRPLTSLEHMLEDSRCEVCEDDKTHIEEMYSLHDFSLSPMEPEGLRSALDDNFKNRCVHHHVFDETNSRALLEASGLRVSLVEFVRPFHIVSLCRVSKG